MWLPLGRAREMYVAGYTDVRQFRWLGAVARMRPGMSVARAQAALDALTQRLEATFPVDNDDLRMRVLPLEERVGGEVRPQLRLLLAGATILFAIAVTNLGGLCLVRAAARRREYAIRAALGASPLRVLGAPALDVALLALLGLALGAALAAWIAPLLAERQAFGLPAFVGVSPSWRVWALAASAVAACASVLVLVPLVVIRRAPARELAGGGRGGSGAAGAARLLDVLTGVEACLATVLLVCAALLFRGLQRHLSTDLGFAREAVATARLDLTGERYRDDARVWTLVRQATEGLRAVPGVRRVALEGPSLPTGGFYGVHLRASDRPASDPHVMGNRHLVSPDYFATLDIPLRRGRAFGDADAAGAPRVVILSEAMARRLWPGVDAVGQRLVTIGQKTNEWTVVGVVADVRHAGLRDADSADPDVYFPLLQTAPRAPSLLNVLVAHGTSPYDATADGIRRAIAAADPLLPVFDARPLEDRLREQTARGRFLATLAAVLGAGALLLAVLGIYGAVAYRTLSEQRLFAIRLALGATSGTVFAFACRRALAPIAIGVGAGLALLGLMAAPLRAQLYGLPALDPVALGTALAAVLLTAAIAVIVPAWRIAGTEPVRALAGD